MATKILANDLKKLHDKYEAISLSYSGKALEHRNDAEKFEKFSNIANAYIRASFEVSVLMCTQQKM